MNATLDDWLSRDAALLLLRFARCVLLSRCVFLTALITLSATRNTKLTGKNVTRNLNLAHSAPSRPYLKTNVFHMKRNMVNKDRMRMTAWTPIITRTPTLSACESITVFRARSPMMKARMATCFTV